MARTRRKFPSSRLVPNGGELSSHIFENQSMGLARSLSWSITVEFEPIKYGRELFSCNLMCEWIVWPLRDWRDLDGQELDVASGDNGVESSFYMGRHDLATRTAISLRHRRENVFSIKVDLCVDFHGYYGGDENPAMGVHAELDLPFIGLMVIPGNLFPKPNTPAELREVASEFVDLARYLGPERLGEHAFVFRPVGFTEDPASHDLG